MTAESYDALSAPFKKNTALKTALVVFNYAVTALFFIAYFALLIVLFYFRDNRVFPTLLTPAVGLLLVTVLRRVINSPRPYEVLDIEPLVHKKTTGKSFPSRHAFSAFCLSVVFSFFHLPVGILCFCLSILLALTRVVMGVHFPRDILVGGIIGVILTTVGMVITLFL